ncbi:MAG: MBL fold metallo-hydrolase RNA specificity domain-containing protein [Vibrio sp.]
MEIQKHQLNVNEPYFLTHHGGKNTVTGSCHELQIGESGILIDCGILQGRNTNTPEHLNIDFPLEHIEALIITHAHIDHIGRIPWLVAAGFNKPIYCTMATAALIPLMLDDGLRIQLNLNKDQRQKVLSHITNLIQPIPYKNAVTLANSGARFQFLPAGHILGSAYVEVTLPNQEVIVFSGDLGPNNTALLPDPEPPKQADYLVIETTYGNKKHDDVATRSLRLEKIVEKALQDGGVILIPAFSVGRTQELLFDIERLIEHSIQTESTDDDYWQQLPIILDSPLALKITREYEKFRHLWNEECATSHPRHPLSFEQLTTIESHQEHERIVNRLASTNEVAIVVAASGMCNGGRIINYLEALLPDERTDVILAGYQAEDTLGRDLQDGKNQIVINSNIVEVNAHIHTMSGYSAHADQNDLLTFIKGIETPPKQIHLVHGELETKHKFKLTLEQHFSNEIIL